MVSVVRDGQRRWRLRPAIVGDRRSGLHLRGDSTVGSNIDFYAGGARVFDVSITRSLQLQALDMH